MKELRLFIIICQIHLRIPIAGFRHSTIYSCFYKLEGTKMIGTKFYLSDLKNYNNILCSFFSNLAIENPLRNLYSLKYFTKHHAVFL